MQLKYHKQKVENDYICYHCGEKINATLIAFDQKDFCCEGCKLVYELLNENNLCTYYSLNSAPGIHFNKTIPSERFTYLDNADVKRKLVHFIEGNEVHVSFYVPKMHCSSCIWLLENLQRLNKGVISSTVNFLKKEVDVVFTDNVIKLSEIVELLTNIGYEPLISLNDLEQKNEKKLNKEGIIKIGIAGFCFGNIMMLSFPEYFSLGNFYDQLQLKRFFGIINLILSIPVFFYCASEFFISAWKGLKQRFLNIDLPIALAILITFSRSLFEIISNTGAGYLDSMSGIIFFMLIGRYFQNITYNNLSFERDYKSYFPISVSLLQDKKELSIPVSQLKKGNCILVRSNEIIPADSILKSESTYIDYSFVTGESRPTQKVQGDLIFAGGRQLQGTIELEVENEVSQSYLTRLWNKDTSDVIESDSQSFIHKVSMYFTISLFTIAASGFLYFTYSSDLNRALNALTAVLIVACPCALLLSATFTNGNMLRIFGRNKFYIKNASVVEKLAKIDTIVFDKTGTITHGSTVKFEGMQLTKEENAIGASVASNSLHPLSRKIYEHFSSVQKFPVLDFVEIPGKGIKALVNGIHVLMGSEYFVTGIRSIQNSSTSKVFFSLDGKTLGFYSINSTYRTGITDLIKDLSKSFNVHLISGDNDAEKDVLKNIIAPHRLHFNQHPEDKLQYIKTLQRNGNRVIMIGDGLNDAGALMQSDVGISVSDDINNFSPSCDAILDGESFSKIKQLIQFSKSGKNIILISFIMSILYNLVGIYYAVQGHLSPVIAAILMPASSISIVLFTTFASALYSKKIGL
jgi:Cu+-exporting ATPase